MVSAAWLFVGVAVVLVVAVPADAEYVQATLLGASQQLHYPPDLRSGGTSPNGWIVGCWVGWS